MSAEVPEAASAEEQKVGVRGERAREASSRSHRGPGPAGRPLPPRAEVRARAQPVAPGAEGVVPVRLGCEGGQNPPESGCPQELRP